VLEAILYVEFNQGIHSIGFCKKEATKYYYDQNISNCRPISLLTSFSKVIEKLMYNRLTDHITSFSILANEQYGFRTRYSTQQATFLLINNILTAMNNKSKIGGIFCDLQKALTV